MDLQKLQEQNVEDEIRTELEAAEQTTHVNIVRVLQLYQTDKELFIVLELMLRDLEDQFEATEEGFYPETIIHILAQLFNVLKYIHQKRKMAHRDLKLKNILVEDFDQTNRKKCYIKLTDFGLAAHLGGEG